LPDEESGYDEPHVITSPDGTLWQRIAASKDYYWYGAGEVKKNVRNETLPFMRNLASDGRYHFENLVPGTYRLFACRPLVHSQNLIIDYFNEDFPITISADSPNEIRVEPEKCLHRN